MSRVGNSPITIPSGVTVTISGNDIAVKGQKGELNQSFESEFVEIKVDGDQATVNRFNDAKSSRARHGLYRSLLNNMVEGVTSGFSKSLEVRGVGYRVAHKGSALEFNLGFSHPVVFELPSAVEVKFDEKNNNIFTLSSIDKQLLGQVASNIRALKKPEPYKGKGIRYTDEHVSLKAGKSGKA